MISEIPVPNRPDLACADDAPTRQTIRVGLIGSGIGQSKSPALHMVEGAAQGLDYRYELIDLTERGLSPEALPDLLAEAERQGFAGVNITHPCKQRVLPLLDALSEDAQAIGAVNTVVFARGRRMGHNTDWSGFYRSFRQSLPEAKIDHVVQLGAGGGGVAVAHAAIRLGVGHLSVCDIDAAQAERLVSSLNARAGRVVATVIPDPAEAMAQADGLINTTPVGMDAHPGLPLDPALIGTRHWVADIVYFPIETALLAAARAKGCAVLPGGGMAVFQAVGAFELFSGRAADSARMQAHFTTLIRNA
ncbi:shikimate dehydrogenase [Pseudotabrizicola algicola]|uniref:Shikimate dehydrogenase n=1 Tax=Pseudotabrizicola algicola TaxID=2709381 RepID=A0A6B3RHA8_9RHOB|nr:shikimate dehydrogenase [Pseudotabrizicola algicola]NEX45417.1 shikimate dehydrogenase [Pseudotabrizicola algicola]